MSFWRMKAASIDQKNLISSCQAKPLKAKQGASLACDTGAPLLKCWPYKGQHPNRHAKIFWRCTCEATCAPAKTVGASSSGDRHTAKNNVGTTGARV
jgi:hypothetical protein